MIFALKSIEEEWTRTVRDLPGGRDEVAAARRLLELDPEEGMPYLFLGNARLDAGDLDEAEACYWEGLNRRPCDFTFYLSLADVRSRRDPDDALSRGLRLLALQKVALLEAVPRPVAEHFGKALRDPELDFTSPETFEILATTYEIENKEREVPPDAAGRLLPYQLLQELQWGAPEIIGYDLLANLRDHADDCVPLLRATVRQWGRSPKSVSDKALRLTIALLGELGGADLVDELLELSTFQDPVLFLHVHWALWRLGQRFPSETLGRLRAAIPAAELAVRCGIAEHLHMLPEGEDVSPALGELLDGFDQFADQEDAAYLLALVTDTLAARGRKTESVALLERYEPTVPRKGRKWMREQLESEDGLVPSLVGAEIDQLDIEAVCIHRVLMDDEEDEEDDLEDDLDDDEEYRPGPQLVRPPRPGRNEPCWCGSGKKYKKCHLDADEQAARTSG